MNKKQKKEKKPRQKRGYKFGRQLETYMVHYFWKLGYFAFRMYASKGAKFKDDKVPFDVLAFKTARVFSNRYEPPNITDLEEMIPLTETFMVECKKGNSRMNKDEMKKLYEYAHRFGATPLSVVSPYTTTKSGRLVCRKKDIIIEEITPDHFTN